MNKDLDYIFPDPPEGVDPRALDPERIPESVAIIMDGNGRWAKKRALNRLKGHKAGIEAVREAIRCASDLGVRYLTIYSFSTENWKRPEDEVVGLMDLFAKTMLAEVDGLHEEGVRVRTIGDLSALPAETREAFDEAWEKTRDNDGMTLVVAVNYGGRQEILRACRGCMREAVLVAAAGRSVVDALTARVKGAVGAGGPARVSLGEVSEMIDVVRLGLSAGLSFDAALEIFCANRRSVLALRLERACMAWQVGVGTRGDELLAAARDLDVRALETFAITVGQALALGAPLAETLAAQSREIREAHRAAVEREIERAPVKLLIPTGTLILPALLLSILGPLLGAGGMM